MYTYTVKFCSKEDKIIIHTNYYGHEMEIHLVRTYTYVYICIL